MVDTIFTEFLITYLAIMASPDPDPHNKINTNCPDIRSYAFTNLPENLLQSSQLRNIEQ